MRSTLPRAALVLLVALAWASAALAAATPLLLQVDPARALGPVPALFRPSVMLSWADPEAVDHLLALPGRFGALRVSVEPLIQRHARESEFFAALEQQAPALAPLAARSGALVVSLVRMPAWLASYDSTQRAADYGYLRREAAPPRVQQDYRRFVARVASTFAPQAPGQLWYESWNEPDLGGFWVADRAALFETWASFARGIRDGDTRARVGSPCPSIWAASTPAPRPPAPAPLLEDFLRFAATRPGAAAPPDFVCWHNFGKHPEQEWWGADTIRGWLAGAGLPRALPQVVSEWNLWTTFPSEREPDRDGPRAAAYAAAALHAMERAGIGYQTLATLQDFRAAGGEDPFHGDFGLLTRAPVVEKAGFKLLAMQARLLPQRVAVSTGDAERADADGVAAIATGDGDGRLAVLVSRYAGDFASSFIRSLGRSGLPGGRGLPLDGKRVERFATGAEELRSGEVSAPQGEALQRARRVARAGVAADAVLALRLRVGDGAARWRYRIYLIDSRHHNPQATYREARAAGQSAAAALAAARAVGFAPNLSGSGVLPELGLERHSVVLYLLEPEVGK